MNINDKMDDSLLIYMDFIKLKNRCVVCQVEYEIGENLVSLQCDHRYHRDCISKWLQINKVK